VIPDEIPDYTREGVLSTMKQPSRRTVLAEKVPEMTQTEFVTTDALRSVRDSGHGRPIYKRNLNRNAH